VLLSSEDCRRRIVRRSERAERGRQRQRRRVRGRALWIRPWPRGSCHRCPDALAKSNLRRGRCGLLARVQPRRFGGNPQPAVTGLGLAAGIPPCHLRARKGPAAPAGRTFYVRRGALPSCRRWFPTALPSACAKRGQQYQQALCLGCAMRRRVIVPDVVLYSADISGCERSAAPAGLMSPMCDAAPCHRAGGGFPRCCHQRVRKVEQHQQYSHLLRAMRRHDVAPIVGTFSAGGKEACRVRRPHTRAHRGPAASSRQDVATPCP